MVGILSSLLMVGAELSKPFAKYISVSIVWSCWGPLRLVTSAPRLHFAFGKAWAAVTLVGRLKCLEVLPPPIPLLLPSWSSSHCSVTATPTPPLPTFPAGTLLLPFSSVDLWSQYKNLPRLRPSSGPSLKPLWHALRRPLIRVTSIHCPILPSGTASSPGTAPVCRSILSLPVRREPISKSCEITQADNLNRRWRLSRKAQ